jgi:hypothetical protein
VKWLPIFGTTWKLISTDGHNENRDTRCACNETDGRELIHCSVFVYAYWLWAMQPGFDSLVRTGIFLFFCWWTLGPFSRSVKRPELETEHINPSAFELYSTSQYALVEFFAFCVLQFRFTVRCTVLGKPQEHISREICYEVCHKTFAGLVRLNCREISCYDTSVGPRSGAGERRGTLAAVAGASPARSRSPSATANNASFQPSASRRSH